MRLRYKVTLFSAHSKLLENIFFSMGTMVLSAGSQSTSSSLSFSTHRAASCSRSWRWPLTTRQKKQCMVRWNLGQSHSMVWMKTPTSISVASSSLISRFKASCGDSPGSIFPPGNSHISLNSP